MERLKKMFAVALCVLTVALCAIVNTSALSPIPEGPYVVNETWGFKQEIVSGYPFELALIYNENDIGYGTDTSLFMIPYTNQDDMTRFLQILSAPNTSGEVQNWKLYDRIGWDSEQLYFQRQETATEHGTATQIVIVPENELKQELYYEFGMYYRFLFTIAWDGEPWQYVSWGGTINDKTVPSFNISIIGEDTDGGNVPYWLYTGVTLHTNIDGAFILNTYTEMSLESDYTTIDITEGMQFFIPTKTSSMQDLNVSFNNGWQEGYEIGYKLAYNQYHDEDVENFSMIDLMSGIITAPVELVKSALDFELFGINMSNFVMVLLTFSIVLFIIVVIFRMVT